MSNQNWDILSCIVLLIISASSCLAEIDLEINQANIGTIPIAIETRHSDDSPLAKQIATIMREDLAYSEKIEVAKNPKYAEFIVRVYSDKNAEQQAKTNESFCMQMEYPMRKSDQVAPKQFCLTGDPKTQIRLIAHQFSDKAHWHITGKSNIFTHRIGFVRETMGKGSKNRYQIVVSDFDQHGEQVLLESPNPIMSLVFSPDGKKLAYVSFEEDIARIFIQDLLTGRREVISQFSGVNSAPSWSPDGSKIAMALSFFRDY